MDEEVWKGQAIHFSKPCKITVNAGDVLIKKAVKVVIKIKKINNPCKNK